MQNKFERFKNVNNKQVNETTEMYVITHSQDTQPTKDIIYKIFTG